MTLFLRQSVAHTSPRMTTLFIGDPETCMVHRQECPARPRSGVSFSDRQTALAQGYLCCTCAAPALVASTDRIRALLATTLSK